MELSGRIDSKALETTFASPMALCGTFSCFFMPSCWPWTWLFPGMKSWRESGPGLVETEFRGELVGRWTMAFQKLHRESRADINHTKQHNVVFLVAVLYSLFPLYAKERFRSLNPSPRFWKSTGNSITLWLEIPKDLPTRFCQQICALRWCRSCFWIKMQAKIGFAKIEFNHPVLFPATMRSWRSLDWL